MSKSNWDKFLDRLHTYGSRKVSLTVLSMLLVTGVGILSYKITSIVAIYPTFTTAIVTLLGIFIGGNSAIKYAYAKKDNSLEGPKSTRTTPIQPSEDED